MFESDILSFSPVNVNVIMFLNIFHTFLIIINLFPKFHPFYNFTVQLFFFQKELYCTGWKCRDEKYYKHFRGDMGFFVAILPPTLYLLLL